MNPTNSTFVVVLVVVVVVVVVAVVAVVAVVVVAVVVVVATHSPFGKSTPPFGTAAAPTTITTVTKNKIQVLTPNILLIPFPVN